MQNRVTLFSNGIGHFQREYRIPADGVGISIRCSEFAGLRKGPIQFAAVFHSSQLHGDIA